MRNDFQEITMVRCCCCVYMYMYMYYMFTRLCIYDYVYKVEIMIQRRIYRHLLWDIRNQELSGSCTLITIHKTCANDIVNIHTVLYGTCQYSIKMAHVSWYINYKFSKDQSFYLSIQYMMTEYNSLPSNIIN